MFLTFSGTFFSAALFRRGFPPPFGGKFCFYSSSLGGGIYEVKGAIDDEKVEDLRGFCLF